MLIMRNHQHRSTILAAYTVQKFHNLMPRFIVKVTRRLIGKQQFRVVQYSPCNNHALLLATRELVRHLVALRRKLHKLKHLDNARFALLLLFPSGAAKHKIEIIVHISVGKQLKILKHNTNLLAQGRQFASTQFAHIKLIEQNSIATMHGNLAIDSFYKRRLSRPHSTYQIGKFSGIQIECYILQNNLGVNVNIYILVIYNGHIKAI